MSARRGLNPVNRKEQQFQFTRGIYGNGDLVAMEIAAGFSLALGVTPSVHNSRPRIELTDTSVNLLRLAATGPRPSQCPVESASEPGR